MIGRLSLCCGYVMKANRMCLPSWWCLLQCRRNCWLSGRGMWRSSGYVLSVLAGYLFPLKKRVLFFLSFLSPLGCKLLIWHLCSLSSLPYFICYIIPLSPSLSTITKFLHFTKLSDRHSNKQHLTRSNLICCSGKIVMSDQCIPFLPSFK
jgi:hypothetical protein